MNNENLRKWQGRTVWHVLAVECKLDRQDVEKWLARLEMEGTEKACGDGFVELSRAVAEIESKRTARTRQTPPKNNPRQPIP